MPGAWLADTLFFIFWRDGFTIPVIIVGGCWFVRRHQSSDEYIDYFAVSLRIIGVLALILPPVVWRQSTLTISGILPPVASLAAY